MEKCCLIIDDDLLNLKFANACLYSGGVDSYKACGFKEAEIILKNFPIKVVFVDYVMPDLDGLRVIKYLHQNIDSNIVCILVTAFPDAITLKESLEIDIFKVIEKPFTEKELVLVAREAIEHYNQSQYQPMAIQLNIPLSVQRKFTSKMAIILKSIDSVNNSYVNDRDWSMDYSQHMGVKTEISFDITKEVYVNYEYVEKAGIQTRNKIGMERIIANIGSEVDINKEVLSSQKRGVAFKSNYHIKMELLALDDKLSAYDDKSIEVIKFESAPVYRRVTCTLENRCNCCDTKVENTVVIDFPTEKIAIRKVILFTDGSSKMIPYGFTEGKISPI